MTEGSEVRIPPQMLFQQRNIDILLDLLQADHRGHYPVELRRQALDTSQAQKEWNTKGIER
jgi:hypothetical protein